jgi:glycosyltransferase involved in cell wall biosynthesis
MKILFFIDSLHSGGKERRLTELMKALASKSGMDFRLVVMNKEIHYKEVLNLNIKIHYLIRKTKKDISIFNDFYKICREFQPDIIHAWNSMTVLYSIPASILLRIKLINGMVANAPLHNNMFNKNWLRAKLTFPFCDLIIANSKAGLKAYPSAIKKSAVVYNGYDFKRNERLISKQTIRKELDISTKFIVGMVASFSKAKDYKTFFKAAGIVLEKRDDVTFLAVGNDTDSLACRQLAESFVKKQFLRLLGKKSNIESYINVTDICVLATFSEGISNSIMEYMALAKPVIATDGGGTVEIVKDKITGYLIKVSDPTELASKIEVLLDSSALRQEFGDLGEERIRTFFSIESMVNKYIHFYNSILNTNPIRNKKVLVDLSENN